MNKNLVLLSFIMSTPLLFTYSDKAALDYCKQNPNTYVAILWPIVEKTHKIKYIESKLTSVANVLYKKEFRLKNNGPTMFIRQVYGSQRTRKGPFSDNMSAVYSKKEDAFYSGSVVRAYLIESNNFARLVRFKRDIRQHFDLNIIHIHDTHAESVGLAHTVFSDPTIEFLNVHKTNRVKNFERLFKEFKEWLKMNKINSRHCCIVGAAVAAVYGIKDCAKIDFIQSPDDPLIPSTPMFINHTSNGDTQWLMDPNQYFYYFGVKCMRA